MGTIERFKTFSGYPVITLLVGYVSLFRRRLKDIALSVTGWMGKTCAKLSVVRTRGLGIYAVNYAVIFAVPPGTAKLGIRPRQIP